MDAVVRAVDGGGMFDELVEQALLCAVRCHGVGGYALEEFAVAALDSCA